MKKKPHLPKECIAILVGILLFVSINLTLNLVTSSVADALPSPAHDLDNRIELASEDTMDTPSEPSTSTDADVNTNSTETPSAGPSAALPTTSTGEELGMERTEDSLETVIGGIVLMCQDYGFTYGLSEISKGNDGCICQCIHYRMGEDVYTDIAAQVSDGTYYISLNDLSKEKQLDRIKAFFAHYGLTIPEAPELTVSAVEPEVAEIEANESETLSPDLIHDEPVIVR